MRRLAIAAVLAVALAVPAGASARLAPLGCQAAKRTARFALEDRFGVRWTKAEKRHLSCERPRISGTRWRTRFGFWDGGPFVFYGTVIVWRWPYDPTRNAYWLTPHLTKR